MIKVIENPDFDTTILHVGDVVQITYDILNSKGVDRFNEIWYEIEADPKWKVQYGYIQNGIAYMGIKILENPFPLVLLIAAIAAVATSLMIYLSLREVRMTVWSPDSDIIDLEEIIVTGQAPPLFAKTAAIAGIGTIGLLAVGVIAYLVLSR